MSSVPALKPRVTFRKEGRRPDRTVMLGPCDWRMGFWGEQVMAGMTGVLTRKNMRDTLGPAELGSQGDGWRGF